jgi:hypothetical protein
MKAYVDFSIYCSPSSAYGNLSGFIDVSTPLIIGEVLNLFPNKLIKLKSHFSDELHIKSITLDEQLKCIVLIELEDVVFSSVERAEMLGAELEFELGLFFVKY